MTDSNVKPCVVEIAKLAEKQLKKLPLHIKEHIRTWAISVEKLGIRTVRKFPGFHDEPLQGERKGQRSIRLNKAYRLIYQEDEKRNLVVVAIMEVNKHDY